MALTNGNHKLVVAETHNAFRNYNGKSGPIYIHKITFTNGDIGEYHTTKPTQEDFVVNKEVEFTCDVKVNGQYTNYKISIKKENNFGGGKSFGGANGKQQVAIAALNAAIKVFELGKIEKDAIEPTMKRFYELINKTSE